MSSCVVKTKKNICCPFTTTTTIYDRCLIFSLNNLKFTTTFAYQLIHKCICISKQKWNAKEIQHWIFTIYDMRAQSHFNMIKGGRHECKYTLRCTVLDVSISDDSPVLDFFVAFHSIDCLNWTVVLFVPRADSLSLFVNSYDIKQFVSDAHRAIVPSGFV